MRSGSFCLALLGSLFVVTAACEQTKTGPRPRPATATEARYLALGDSFTIGTGSAEDLAFPARLVARWRQNRCAIDLRNVARNGFTTDDLIAQELPEVDRYRPTFVTLAIGANDIVRGRSAEVYRANVRHIVEAIRASGAQRIVVLPQPDWSQSDVAPLFGDRAALATSIRRFNDILADEARSAGATYVDLFPLMERQAGERLLAEDGLHPSAMAYGAWADHLAQEIESPCAR